MNDQSKPATKGTCKHCGTPEEKPTRSVGPPIPLGDARLRWGRLGRVNYLEVGYVAPDYPLNYEAAFDCRDAVWLRHVDDPDRAFSLKRHEVKNLLLLFPPEEIWKSLYGL